MTSSNKKSSKGFWQRLNDALTEVGIEHADDDRDWDIILSASQLPNDTAERV